MATEPLGPAGTPSEGRHTGSAGLGTAVLGLAAGTDRCIDFLRHVLPQNGFGLRLLLTDGRGHLRAVRSEGDPLQLGPRQARARRMTLVDGVTRILEDADDRVVGLFPIDRRDQALGIAEVSTSSSALDRHRRDVEAAVGRLSADLKERAGRDRLTRELQLGLAWTAHELRGPLQAARLWLEHAAASRPDAGEPIRRAIGELSRLAEGVDSVLHWSIGDLRMHCRRADLVGLVQEAVDCCVGETGEDRVVLEGSERLVVRADALHLRSAIENLIRNAIRYSTPHTKIRVTVEPRDGQPVVEVENEGDGIAPDDRERIFEPLAHASNGAGTGLGLFVARRIAERHGGTIRCHQPGEGRIAFELRLSKEIDA